MEAEFIDLISFLIKMFNVTNFHLSTVLAEAYKFCHVVTMSLPANSNICVSSGLVASLVLSGCYITKYHKLGGL